MSRLILVFVLCVIQINTLSGGTPEAWVTRARVVHPIPYFSAVMQEFVNEVERREWCNLKLLNITKDINTVVANWNVTGQVKYTNGFLVSIQKLDVHQIRGSVSRRVVNNVTLPSATVSGNLLFHDVSLGYDVNSNLAGIGEQRYTGQIMLQHIRFHFNIIKDLITKEITVTSTMDSISSPHARMVYRPANHITEMLSRHFASGDNSDGARSWSPGFIVILTNIVRHKIDFPLICFNNC